MKKIFVLTMTVAILAALTIGVAMAQSEPPETPIPESCPNCGGNLQNNGQGGRGSGYLAAYMHAAMAEALGIPVEEFESRIAAGESFYDMALELGFDMDSFFDLHLNARQIALENAFDDGLFSEEQFNWMMERFQGQGGGGFGMHGRGSNNSGFSGGGRPGGCMQFTDLSSPAE